VLRILADDKQSALALDDLALRTALANGWTYFHDDFLLNSCRVHKVGIILALTQSVQLECYLPWLRDSQDERVAFGDSHRVFLVSRQGTVSRDNRPLVGQDTGPVRANEHHWLEGNRHSGS